MTIYAGRRILAGIKLRKPEIIILEKTNTNVAAIPIPKALNNEVDTAKVGHKPKINPNVGLSIVMPLVNSLIKLFIFF